MSKHTEIVLWNEPAASIVPSNLTEPREIASFAAQLSAREKQQVVTAYGNGSYEMATSFVWGRALKRELGSLGLTFLAEMLGRTDIVEDDNVLDAITEREAIKLAEELGVVSRAEAIRLRHAQELVSFFAQRDPAEEDDEMEITDAVGVLLTSVKSVLAKPSIQVAQKFADFRKELESKTFTPDDPQCDTLVGSPYFFRRLAIAVLLAGIRAHTGAKLEHCLANLNLFLPLLWSTTREPERWQVGSTYAQVYADGLQIQTSGLKHALLKVRGFDYVPENLRSQSFLKAADAIIRAHEGMNNFYNEEAPTLHLERMGTVIPAPAIGPCITALLCVRLGNSYGTSWAAWPTADKLLKAQAPDRWIYYLDKILPGETRILDKLLDSQPQEQWITLAQATFNTDMDFKEKLVSELVSASLAKENKRIASVVAKLVGKYYSHRKS